MDIVRLRPVEDDDVEVFHQYESDPEAQRRSAFPARERDAFFKHWAKIRVDPTVTLRTVLIGDEVAGHIAAWGQDGQYWVGYWLGRAYWGRGIGSQAMRLFLAEVDWRPLYADPAEQNVGSVRLLQKCGFHRAAEQPPSKDGVQHVLLVLDQ